MNLNPEDAPADPIVAVEAITAHFPLPAPLLIGDLNIAAREYAFVQIRSAAGYVGKAYVLSHGLPVDAIINNLFRPVLVNQDSSLVAALWEECYRSTVAAGRVGVVMRALSLVDTALWDIKAQRAGMPLWQLLGGYRTELPAMIVAGYLTETRGPDEISEELVRYAEAGYTLLKIARSLDNTSMRRLLGLLLEALPATCGVVVDGLWGWRTAAEVERDLASWEVVPELGNRLAWLEDPFPPENVQLYKALSRAVSLPVGVGDDLTDAQVMRSLISEGCASVARVDALAIGGITAALRMTHFADINGVAISPHVCPEVHVHLGAALPGCVAVEMFDPAGNDLDVSYRFVTDGPKVSQGNIHAPTAPGLGFDIDWEFVRAHAVAT
jgi:L-alanine-DL-glutamate epimerase-like enolase superfamily enzyme